MGSDDSHELRLRRLRLVGAILLAASIFLVDTLTTLHSGVAVLYVLVLVIVHDGVPDRRIVRVAAVCAGLAIVSFSLNGDQSAQVEPVLRLVIGLAALAVTATLLQRNGQVQHAARSNDRRYRKIFDTLAVAIWEHDFSEVEREIAAIRAGGVEDLRSHLESHPETVVRLRKMVRITDANDTALRLLQVPSKEHFFSRLSDFLPEDDESFLEGLLAIDENRAVFETETQVCTMHGDRIDVFINLSLVDTGDGLARVCGSIMDVTERKRVQIALERTRVELDQAIRAATVGELSASIAHEVSQPISAVRAFTEAARRWLAKTPPDVAEALTAINQAAHAAINAGDVVDRVRKLVSRSDPELLPVDLHLVIRSAVEAAQRQLVGATLEMSLAPVMSQVIGDRILLQHLMTNILNNAVEAMDRAAVLDRRVSVELTEKDGLALVTVCDNGPGFAAEAAARAFDPFFSTREGGVGIGLAMCRSIIEAHGGMIEISGSNTLSGASIRVAMPARNVP